MTSVLKLQIWLKDGSSLKDCTLTQADLKVGILAFDMNTFDKLDDAYLYVLGGTKIYRDRVTGTIDIHSPGIAGSLSLPIEQIEEMLRADAGANLSSS